MDTIAAIATPIGSGAIGIVRISGPRALDVASQVFVPDPRNLASHSARHGKLMRPIYGSKERECIDDVVITVFRAPHSYTGEDTVEISCHGGLATVRSTLRATLDAGARLAEPGEFTQRAFLNGKLDLAKAEAVNDIIRARTDDARKIALRQLDGDLSARVIEINKSILGLIAAIEAAIDFPDDVDEPEVGRLQSEMTLALNGVNLLIESFDTGRIYREGLRVVIAGQVNVGKSSLLNALLRHARAIVTPIPGTTRDLIEESLEIQGIPIVAIDTAGLRTTDDPVESIGVELTRRSIGSADIILLVIDASKGLCDEDRLLLAETNNASVLIVANKADLLAHPCQLSNLSEGVVAISTSALTGQGIEDLETKIADIAKSSSSCSEGAIVTNARHQQALKSASESLLQALATLARSEPIDLLSGDLLAARNALGLITGETATDDLLDRIFSEFCIGK